MTRIPRTHPLVRVWEPPTWLEVTWDYVTSAAAALLAVVEYLDIKISPNKLRWLHSDQFQLWFAGSILGVIAVDAFWRGWRRQRTEREANLELRLHKTLGAAIATVSEIAGVSASELGAGIYLRQGHRFRAPKLRLPRAVRFRLLDHIADSGIRFVPGKGAVGRAWETRNPVHHSWQTHNDAFGADGPTWAQWDGLPEDEKHGFTHEEFSRMCGRYSEVVAVPIVVGSEPVGVLAVDLIPHACEDPGFHLIDEAVLKSLGLTASALAKDL